MKGEQADACGLEIAVIGMSGRFPQGPDIESYWRNLKAGVECISFFSSEELEREGVQESEIGAENYVAASGALRDSTHFDEAFFSMTPREAELTDPQNRLFLECAWEALEDAAYDPALFPGTIGVFAGKSMSEYLLFALARAPHALQGVNLFQFFLGNDKDFLATQTAYRLDLKGPCVTVQSACSTSLAAAHLACQSLLGGECDMALAGGVSLRFPCGRGYFYEESGILSPDGHCRAFDARAQGTVPGSGAGIVVLKRLADAVASGDNIRAVIRGSALNNDGLQKFGFTAPSIAGQAAVIRAAHAVSGIRPSEIDYVETHGTGTSLGDPVEVAALREVFQTEDRAGPCFLGAVKPNIGHLDAAAGVAGLIKAVLVLQHGQLPPLINFQTPNPALELDDKVFSLNTSLRRRDVDCRLRYAGVSSFGMGGANAHLVLEKAPEAASPPCGRTWHLLPVSARSEAALRSRVKSLENAWKDHPEWTLPDVAFTLQNGRRTFACRTAIVAVDAERARISLSDAEQRNLASSDPEAGIPRLVFMFPGQGTQQPGMGWKLCKEYRFFRDQLHAGLAMAGRMMGVDLVAVVSDSRGSAFARAREELRDTAVAQPVLFAFEYALAKLWMSWGITPWALIGHSLGELVAACLAGVLDFEHAIQLVTWRGRLMASLPRGAMLAATLPRAEAERLLNREVSLAAVNGPRSVVFSGSPVAMDALEDELRRMEVACRKLQTSHAFHSFMMAPAIEDFHEKVAKIPLHPPRIPYISCVTGRWILAEEATSPDYWARQLRQTVLFRDGLELLAQEHVILLEVGIGNTLSGAARQCLHNSARAAVPVFSGLPAGEGSDEAFGLMDTLGKLWMHGVSPRWTELCRGESRLRVPLPAYPFERKNRSIFVNKTTTARVESVAAKDREARGATGLTGSGFSSAAKPSSSQEEIEAALAEIWRELLGVVPGARTDNFFDLGGTSLVALDLITRVQKRFGRKLFLNDVAAHPTLEGLSDFVRSAPAGPTRLPLVCLQSAGASPPLFLVHPVGGTVICYQTWIRALGMQQPVYAFQARSVTEDTGLPASLEDMARAYTREIRGFSGPYILGGWSLGGVVAFEMARQLREMDRAADLLVLVDSHPFLQKQLTGFSMDMERTAALLQEALQTGHGLAQRELPSPLARLAADAGVGAAGDRVDPDQLRGLARAYQLNIRLLKDYVPGHYAGNIVLFRALDQSDAAEPDLGWGALASGRLEVVTLPGDHYSIMQEHNVARIVHNIREQMKTMILPAR